MTLLEYFHLCRNGNVLWTVVTSKITLIFQLREGNPIMQNWKKYSLIQIHSCVICVNQKIIFNFIENNMFYLNITEIQIYLIQ